MSNTDSQNNSQANQQSGQTEQTEAWSQTEECASQEGSGVEKEKQYKTEVGRQKSRKRKRARCEGDNSDSDEDDDYVEARVPRDLLRKLSLLSVNLGLSVRQQLSMTMATYELVGE